MLMHHVGGLETAAVAQVDPLPGLVHGARGIHERNISAEHPVRNQILILEWASLATSFCLKVAQFDMAYMCGQCKEIIRKTSTMELWKRQVSPRVSTGLTSMYWSLDFRAPLLCTLNAVTSRVMSQDPLVIVMGLANFVVFAAGTELQHDPEAVQEERRTLIKLARIYACI